MEWKVLLVNSTVSQDYRDVSREMYFELANSSKLCLSTCLTPPPRTQPPKCMLNVETTTPKVWLKKADRSMSMFFHRPPSCQSTPLQSIHTSTTQRSPQRPKTPCNTLSWYSEPSLIWRLDGLLLRTVCSLLLPMTVLTWGLKQKVRTYRDVL